MFCEAICFFSRLLFGKNEKNMLESMFFSSIFFGEIKKLPFLCSR